MPHNRLNGVYEPVIGHTYKAVKLLGADSTCHCDVIYLGSMDGVRHLIQDENGKTHQAFRLPKYHIGDISFCFMNK